MRKGACLSIYFIYLTDELIVGEVLLIYLFKFSLEVPVIRREPSLMVTGQVSC